MPQLVAAAIKFKPLDSEYYQIAFNRINNYQERLDIILREIMK